MDTVPREKRSWIMSQIKGRDTKPEFVVRSLLHMMGYRFRLHRRDLPGRPDIVLPKYGISIFVNGCFWHRHKGCRFAYEPKSRKRFWLKKFTENVERDGRVKRELKALGWRVITIWECQTRSVGTLSRKLEKLAALERDSWSGRTIIKNH